MLSSIGPVSFCFAFHFYIIGVSSIFESSKFEPEIPDGAKTQTPPCLLLKSQSESRISLL